MTADPVIVFHAGFHKTGTTSLQAALHLHAPLLYPAFAIETRTRSEALRHAAEAARDCSADPGPQTSARLAARIDDWARGLQLGPQQGLLVSCEDFAGHMPGRFGVRDYRAVHPIAATLRGSLQRHLPQHRLTFLFTTREPDAWLRAIHWQLSRHEEMMQGAARFARRFAPAAAFGPLLDELGRQLPDIPLHIADLADLAPRRLGPVEALYDAANLPDDLRRHLPTPPHANRTPPHDLARIFVKLNRSDLPREEVQRLKRDMLAAENLFLGDGDLFAVPAPDLPR